MKRADVVQSIRSLKGTEHTANPDANWIASSRVRLLNQIDRTTEVIPTRIFSLVHLWSVLSLIMPQRTVYAVVRPAFIFVVCFSLGTAGWLTTVSASLESLPGDTLYPVKLATEHTQVAVVEAMKGSAASTELRLSFVTRRVDEVNKVVAAPAISAAARQERVDIAVENLKTEVQTVSEKLSDVKLNNPESVIHVAQVIERKVDAIQQSLEVAGVTTSSTAAVVAIAQLKQDAVAESASSTTPTATTSSLPIANTTSTVILVIPTPEAGTTTTIVIEPVVRAPIPTPIAAPVAPDSKLDTFPERPPELGPEVVDSATPISIQLLN